MRRSFDGPITADRRVQPPASSIVRAAASDVRPAVTRRGVVGAGVLGAGVMGAWWDGASWERAWCDQPRHHRHGNRSTAEDVVVQPAEGECGALRLLARATDLMQALGAEPVHDG